jgi:hypothetical protein
MSCVIDIEYAPRACGKRKTLVLISGTEGMRVGVMLKLSYVSGSSVSRLGVRKADRWQSNALFAFVVQWLPTTIKWRGVWCGSHNCRYGLSCRGFSSCIQVYVLALCFILCLFYCSSFLLSFTNVCLTILFSYDYVCM